MLGDGSQEPLGRLMRDGGGENVAGGGGSHLPLNEDREKARA
ncbi:hypothetical protein [Polyangium sp. 15x6]|nr:hypothetical protein [Polyangium sp. 15x6]MDI3290173.1 hypothetical protein [Polyangium sp. 15x6]